MFPAVNAVVSIVAIITMVVFPSSLTEEEEALQKKYAKLKKKVKKLKTCKMYDRDEICKWSKMEETQSPQLNSFCKNILSSVFLQKKALLALKKQSSTNQTNQSGLKRSMWQYNIIPAVVCTVFNKC